MYPQMKKPVVMLYISSKSQFYISCRQSMAMLLVRMEIMDGLTEEEVIITKLICITKLQGIIVAYRYIYLWIFWPSI